MLTTMTLFAFLAEPAAAAVTPAERRAAAVAAGFRLRGATIINECDLAVENLTVERRDLNGDGAPELIVTDESGCYGAAGIRFAVLRKAGAGWSSVLMTQGVMTVKPTRRGGWPDIEIGGPGFGRMPVARWNGSKYVW